MEQIITQIKQIQPALQINTAQLPEGHDMNTMWINYGREAITELINDYPKELIQSGLEILNEHKIKYTGKAADYYIIGHLSNDMGNMKVSLQIVAKEVERKHRIKIDLFDSINISNQCRDFSDKYQFDMNLMEVDLIKLTDLLEQHRESLYEVEMNPITDKYSEKELTPRAAEKAVEFLSNARLLQNIDKLLEQAGIIGEEANRILLYIIVSSYKMSNPLHGMLQGTSGGGKSHLINYVAECIPQEDLLDMTRITSKSLYHYKDKELTNKLIIIQDFNGLDEEAQFAFREIQSHKKLSSSTVVKDMLGNTKGKIKTVTASFASLVATTKTEVYLDNSSRSVLMGIDESNEQTQRIIQRQNQKRTGTINAENEKEAKQLLRNCLRVLKKYDVINPFADKLVLPDDARMLRRLNEQFQDFIEQITILHQYQRKKDDKGRLIATKEDIKMATEIFFNAIVLKVDELDGSTRQFFEQLKTYVKAQPTGTTYKFTQREIRQETKLAKTTVFKYMQLLQELEYIQAVEGSANKGFKYVVSYWDSMEKLKVKIKEDLNKQTEML